MPPGVPVAQVAGVAGASSWTFATPVQTKAGDTLLAVMEAADAAAGPDYADDLLEDWEELATFTGAGRKIWILRREAQAEDSSQLEIPFTDIGALAILAVCRNLDTSAAAVSSSSTAIAASTNFVCPSRTLGAYSDLYLGIVLVTTAAVAVAPPAGCTERLEVQGGAKTLELFDHFAEAVGATGTKTSTTAGAQSGIAASIALQADALRGFGLSFIVDPIGAIGLPSRGV